MPLAANTRLGPYEIVAPLGAGGMGEVYRARDSRLGREVAIKVLPQHLSAHPEVRARFEREAKTVSSLNHPHICTLHDVGREGEIDYLVMELVEGETLAERIAKGPLPVPEVLRLGGQIADALDKAHRAGVVHRDLKPGNVMLTKSGAKLMDFGLARATGLAGPAGGSGLTMAALTQSPTVAQPLTAEGSIVGTFQYMAPEQLEGKEADARTDLFSFGLVLYEMVTGRRAFEGKSQASLIAAILEREPAPITSLVPLAPPALERLVGACLAKDPDQRIQTAHDAKLQLQWIAEGGSQLGVPLPVATRRRSRERLSWALAAAGVAATIVLATVLGLRSRDEAPVTRFIVSPPPGQSDVSWPRISPDGKWLAFLAVDTSNTSRLWVRPLSAFEAQPLPGTEGASRPFWSPDSKHLAFMSEGKLKKVPAAGGPSILIGDATGRADGTWGAGGTIILDGFTGDSLLAVPAAGGVVRPVSALDRSRSESGHTWPFFLPDGRHFVFHALRIGKEGTIKLGRLGSTESWDLGISASRAEFAPPHYLLYIREGTLVAHVLDLGKRKLIGDPVPLTDRLVTSRNDGEFSIGPAGVLAFTRATDGGASELVWMDRNGKRLGQAAPPRLYREIALAPDGRRAAVTIESAPTGNEDVWVLDLERGVASRLTFDAGNEVWPIWFADGERVLYATDRAGSFRMMSRLASGVGAEDSLTAPGTGNEGPSDISRDGQWVASVAIGGTSNWDLWVRRSAPGAAPQPFLATPHIERDASFSPDGRWLAYRSNETGRAEIYVRSFPDGGGKWQVSNAGGFDPVWRADGREMFYLTPDGAIMAVPLEPGETFRSGAPVELFRFTMSQGGFIERRWCATRDGQRFLINTPVGQAQRSQFAVAINWISELAKK